MNVTACMSFHVRLTSPTHTIRDAATAMREEDVGLLPVGENDKLVGVITDRDIAIRAVAAGLGPDTPVRDVMSAEVLFCYDDDDLDDAAQKMGDLQVRRLPVLERENGQLVGIISMADIARAGDHDVERTGAALSEISEPTGSHAQH